MPIWCNNCNPGKLNFTTVVLCLVALAEAAEVAIFTQHAHVRDYVIRAGVHLYICIESAVAVSM